MRKKKKTRGIRYKIRGEKKREQCICSVVAVAILVIIFFISVFLINSMLNQSSTSQITTTSASEPKAAIVDQLSLTSPNQTFIEKATKILEQAGYKVDYYPGEKVTVEFYRNLPTHGYKIIILRVHSSATLLGGTEGPTVLFSSERFNPSKYVYEQRTDQLWRVVYSAEEREEGIVYFGVTPLFVMESMKGKFENAVIVMMGCEGLDNPLMAEAFVNKGAKVYIGWNQKVSASYTDLATTHFLKHFLIEKRTVKEAIQETYKEVGADPAYKSLLIAYPIEALNCTIEDIYEQLSPDIKT